jgi:hypothetical protein
MLKAVRQVCDGLIKDIGGCRTYDLETITRAVEAYAPVDEIFYVGYDSSPDNPILGEFSKFGRQPTVYSGTKTIVEIRYANHLDVSWRRFVVCKELCHALESDEGTRSVTNKAVERLISNFSLLSTRATDVSLSPAFDAEMLAEIGALELLCPLQFRAKLRATYDEDVDRTCDALLIPRSYSFAFKDDVMQVIKAL